MIIIVSPRRTIKKTEPFRNNPQKVTDDPLYENYMAFYLAIMHPHYSVKKSLACMGLGECKKKTKKKKKVKK